MRNIYHFVHIPKCGGRTVYDGLTQIFGQERVLDLCQNKTHQSMYAEKRIEFDRFDAIAGHVPYGQIAYTKDVSPVYISVVRDPLDRFISHYNYLRTISSPPEGQSEISPAQKADAESELGKMVAACENIEDFLHGLMKIRDPSWISGNIQASYLCGTRGINTGFALEQLQKYESVVPMDQVPRLLEMVADREGRTRPIVGHRNRSTRFIEPSTVTPEFADRLKDRLSIDYSIYEHVRRANAAEAPQ